MGKALIRKYWFFFIWVFLAVLFPLIWIRSDFIYFSEEDLFANYQRILEKNSFAWSNEVNLGIPAHPSEFTEIIPNGLFYSVLSGFGIPNFLIQKLFLFLILLLTFLSITYFLRLFTRNKIVIISAGLFYYLNFYVKSTLFYSPKMYQLIMMPLLFTFTYLYLKTKHSKYAVYSFISLFFFQGLFSNLAALLVTLSVIPIAFFYVYYQQEEKFISFVKKNLSLAPLYFLLLTPIFIYNAFVYYYSFFALNIFDIAKSFQTFSALSSPLNLIFQFRGAWWEFAGFEGVSYNPWLWFYNHPAIVAISFIFIAFYFFQLMYRLRNKTILYWTFIFFLSVLIASGSSLYPPLYLWLYKHVPLFYIFREPWAKFTPLTLLSSTVLLTVFLSSVNRKALVYLVIIFIIIRGLPFFSGNFFYYETKRWYIPFVKLPDYWQEFERWSQKNKEITLLSVPINYFRRNWYRQDLGNVNHPLFRVFGYTKVVYDLNNNALGSLVRYFIEREDPNIIKITSVDYVLDQRDIETNPSYFTEEIKSYNNKLLSFFEQNPVLNFSNKLYIKSVKPAFKLPLIYAPRQIFISGDLDDLREIISKSDYPLYSTVFLKSQNLQKLSSLGILGNHNTLEEPYISYKFINPTKYTIFVKHAKRLFPLTFNETYHDGWNLKTQNSPSSSIPQEFHLVSNAYSNSWIVDPKNLCGNRKNCTYDPNRGYSFTLTLTYEPQRLFDFLFLINGTFLIVGVIYLILNPILSRSAEKKYES